MKKPIVVKKLTKEQKKEVWRGLVRRRPEKNEQPIRGGTMKLPVRYG